MLSIMANQNEITEILIRKGANLELKDNEGKTALLLAISKDNIEAVRMLIDAGVNFDIAYEIRNEECFFKNVTPLLWASIENNTEALKILINAGANIDIKFEYRKDEMYLKNAAL